MSQIETKAIYKSYHSAGGMLALAGIDLKISQGEFACLIGPSGCGKSTLLRILGGLLPPTSGQVLIDGSSPAQAQVKKKIGVVFQDPALLPWRTAVANIRLPLEVNTSAKLAMDPVSLLNTVGMGRFQAYYPYQLSGGMQQRVALARALVFDPPVLLMDEPFGALDEITRGAMRYELTRLWEQNRKTVLFVTHSISEAITLGDRVLVMSPSPGVIKASVKIDLPRPRVEAMEFSSSFQNYHSRLKELLK